MWRLNDLFGVMAPHPIELLSVLAFEHLPEIAARAKQLLDTNRALLKEFFNSRKDLLAIWPEAGTIAFPQLISGHADAFCQLLRDKYDTSVVPGRFWSAGAFPHRRRREDRRRARRTFAHRRSAR